MNSVTIRNTQIKQNEEGLISLTDIWKASGEAKQDSPYHWLRLDEARTFIAHIGKTTDVWDLQSTEIEGVLEKKRGRKGGTYATAQIALAYAKWLSPELHEEVNDLFLRAKAGDPSVAEETLDNYMQNQDRDPEWDTSRIRGKLYRAYFTDVLAAHDVSRRGFGMATNMLYQGALGKNNKQLREERGLPTESGKMTYPATRDHMTREELTKTLIAEELAAFSIQENGLKGDEQCSQVANKAGKAAKRQVESFAIGDDIVSDQ
jgi:hypothetical protein